MSQSERKILTAKRHGERSFHRPHNSSFSHHTTNQGTKRNRDSEQNDQPPNKRSNSFYQPPKSSNTPSKNLAERRLQNLRKSLETQRRQSEGGAPTASSAFTPNSPVPKKPEQQKINIPTLPSSTPVQNLLKRKVTDRQIESPCISNIQKTFSSPVSNKPIEKINTINNDEEMEWNEIDETAVVNDINDLRKEINYNKELPNVAQIENKDSLSTDGVYIVVDTNIFLSQLNLLNELKEIYFEGFGRATIVVPWMVIQELDYMKESHSSGNMVKAARKAVHFINSQLATKDPHFTGQSVMDAAKLEMASKNPDDGIVFSCMQLIEKGKFVTMLSNDVNLRNKALINKIQSYGSTEIISNLKNLKTLEKQTQASAQSVQKIKILLSNMLTHIIESEMKEAYGEVWHKMAMMTPPFTTEEALNCLQKYWVAVFSFSLQKQCKLKIEEFITFFKAHRNDSSFKTVDFTKFVELTLSLCIYLKNGYSQYKHIVCECITNVQKCATR